MAPAPPKIVTLHARPYQAAQLCFEGSGILGQLNVQLGDAVKAFDFDKFHATLRSSPTKPAEPSRLLYDAEEIEAFADKIALAALRSEPIKAALTKAIGGRQNAYFAKYGHIPSIVNQIQQFYGGGVGSKGTRLAHLSTIANDQWYLLGNAYRKDLRQGVVRNTRSILRSDTATSGYAEEHGETNQDSASITADPGVLPKPPDSGWSVKVLGDPGVPGGGMLETMQMTANSQTTVSREGAHQEQTIINTDYGYRVPYLEDQAQYERAQISLIDQRFAEFMYGQNLSHLVEVFRNELTAIDSDIPLRAGPYSTIFYGPSSTPSKWSQAGGRISCSASRSIACGDLDPGMPPRKQRPSGRRPRAWTTFL